MKKWRIKFNSYHQPVIMKFLNMILGECPRIHFCWFDKENTTRNGIWDSNSFWLCHNLQIKHAHKLLNYQIDKETIAGRKSIVQCQIPKMQHHQQQHVSGLQVCHTFCRLSLPWRKWLLTHKKNENILAGLAWGSRGCCFPIFW